MIGDCRARDPAGRAALIDAYDLSVPVTRVLSAIGATRRIIEQVAHLRAAPCTGRDT
jgi:hypothetical protein